MYARGNDGLRRKRRRSGMNIRETMEQWERQNLSPYASLSSETLGRDREEPLCDIRPAYQRDRDRILHSKSFRRLKDKTQVFLAPEGDHYRTRLTHTLEVSQIARTIAKALRMNESLTEAIALGHDLGHTPFGHKDRWPVHTVIDNIMDHDIQAVLYGIPKYICVFSRNIPLGNDLSADRVVDIMIDVCDFIGEPHDLSLHGRRISGRSVI